MVATKYHQHEKLIRQLYIEVKTYLLSDYYERKQWVELIEPHLWPNKNLENNVAKRNLANIKSQD